MTKHQEHHARHHEHHRKAAHHNLTHIREAAAHALEHLERGSHDDLVIAQDIIKHLVASAGALDEHSDHIH